jgi:ActR/RegA family two-component response regulator
MSTPQCFLIVADDPNAHHTLRVRLERRGHVALFVRDAAGALARLRECTPNAVVVDLAVDRDGRPPVIESLRADARYAGLRVVALAAAGPRPDGYALARLGVVEILVPEVTAVDRLIAVLEGGGPPRAARVTVH